ncbi:MAG: hypothetical protein A3F70_08290 [Acidobacteria bacterium RIFCSPLOWO2_12_FULL_67_14]|nr:MAG: hypothetical protein A3H29_06075 [Acidobacteria bacterium RIFCSPLOWO2_02_FULL_67_21]OFW38207.1 MAG: hypothetical protein A3F70_08290 [Acidobacteria bacterium RIFCSPLOWO2_12_FULL_67_14]
MDANDRPPQTLLVGPDLGRQVRQRRLAAELPAQLLARRFELPPLPPDAARPCILAQRVDHRAADPPLGKRLELDAARFVKPVRRVDEANHPVLHQVPDIDGVRHGRRNAPCELFDERERGNHAPLGLASGGTHAVTSGARGRQRRYQWQSRTRRQPDDTAC